MSSKCVRLHHFVPKFQKFPGGACPRTPLTLYSKLALRGLLPLPLIIMKGPTTAHPPSFLITMIAAEHRWRSETNLVKWIEIAAMDVGILVMWQVMANCNANRKWVWFTQTAVRAHCFAVNALGFRTPRSSRPACPSLSWPSHRSTTWPVTLACAFALSETVSGRVFGYPGLVSCVMRCSTSLLLENYTSTNYYHYTYHCLLFRWSLYHTGFVVTHNYNWRGLSTDQVTMQEQKECITCWISSLLWLHATARSSTLVLALTHSSGIWRYRAYLAQHKSKSFAHPQRWRKPWPNSTPNSSQLSQVSDLVQVGSHLATHLAWVGLSCLEFAFYQARIFTQLSQVFHCLANLSQILLLLGDCTVIVRQLNGFLESWLSVAVLFGHPPVQV